MRGDDVGRDAPCPCGSGRKHEHCCLGREDAIAPSSVLRDAVASLRQALEGKEFGSEEELQTFVRSIGEQRNRQPLDDFCGLSPAQMHRLLDFPFDSPQLVVFPTCLGVTPTGPFVTLFRLLAEAIDERGLKATARGNLPRKFVQEASLALEREGEDSRWAPGSLRSEADFLELHVTRLVAELSGLVRRSKGRFLLRRDARRAVADLGAAALYFDARQG